MTPLEITFLFSLIFFMGGVMDEVSDKMTTVIAMLVFMASYISLATLYLVQ